MGRTDGIFKVLDTVGDGSGTYDAIGDYSVTPQSFKITDTTGWGVITRMMIMLEDSGSFDSGLYGNGLALTNGVRIYLKNSSDEVLQEYTSFPIKTNGEWAGHCYDLNYFNWGSGNEVATIRWTFSNSGQPIEVHFNEGEYLEVYLNDDFSGLVKHRFTVQGHYKTRPEIT